MFAGGVAHKLGAYAENGDRKHQTYCDKQINSDADDDDADDDDDDNNAHIENCSARKYSTDSEEQNNKNLILDNNYNCHYKIKAVQMSAIRCRLNEQQYEERKLYYQQQQQQQQQQLREESAHTVINLARSHAMLEAMEHQQQHQHINYALPAHNAHIATYTTSQQQHDEQQRYALAHNVKRQESTDLTNASYENSRTLSPATAPTTLTTTTATTSSSATSLSTEETTTITTTTSAAATAAAAAAANRRDHNIDYSTLFVQLSGTLPTLYRCVNCNKIVSNRWHHANIHRPQSHVCPVCGQKFTRRDNMKAHCKIKHADIKDHFFSHYVHM